MRYVVGVDGGGTKTTAAVVSEQLGPVGSATTGPANHRSVGIEAAGMNIAEAIAGALRAAAVSLSDVAAICLCLAGFDTDLDLPVPHRAVRILGYDGVALFENDVVGAWAGAFDGDSLLRIAAQVLLSDSWLALIIDAFENVHLLKDFDQEMVLRERRGDVVRSPRVRRDGRGRAAGRAARVLLQLQNDEVAKAGLQESPAGRQPRDSPAHDHDGGSFPALVGRQRGRKLAQPMP